jgi:Rieske Fe-S protein
MELISRKAFIRSLVGITGSFFAYLFYKSLRINDNIISSNNVQTVIKNDFQEGFSFVDNLIVVRKNQKIEIFSDKCTHLGCKINKFVGDELVCSCHGSKFSDNGQVITGPAKKNLKKISFQLDNLRNVIILNNEA